MIAAAFLAGDLLIVAALLAVTVLVRRLWRDDDVWSTLHWAAGISAAVVLILAAGVFFLDAVLAVRALMATALLVVTAPLSISAIAGVARRGERERDG